jgi:hypothetical protein
MKRFARAGREVAASYVSSYSGSSTPTLSLMKHATEIVILPAMNLPITC